MRFPLSMTTKLSKYIAGKRLRRVEKFPLVMMLEPLHACNLTCTGCGRIREYKETITEQLTVEQCLKAVDDCGSPIVSICGGEPTIYRPLGQLVTEILDRGKHIYLCTHGMFIKKRLKEFKPTSHFFFNVHLDGMEATHDLCVERKGVFRQAIDGIRAAKDAGFMVCTNTTIYKQTDLKEIAELFEYLKEFGVDGHTIAPSYSYAAVQNKEIFMSRQEIHEKFRQATKHPGEIRPDDLSDLPGLPARRTRRHAVHRLGKSHLQPTGLESAVLSDYRRPSRHVQGLH